MGLTPGILTPHSQLSLHHHGLDFCVSGHVLVNMQNKGINSFNISILIPSNISLPE